MGVEKKDWENAIIQLESMIVNDILSKQLSDISFEDKLNSYKKQIEFCKTKIKEIEEEDPKPEGVDDLLK